MPKIHDPRLRAEALRRLAEGQSPEKVAADLRVRLKTVAGWLEHGMKGLGGIDLTPPPTLTAPPNLASWSPWLRFQNLVVAKALPDDEDAIDFELEAREAITEATNNLQWWTHKTRAQVKDQFAGETTFHFHFVNSLGEPQRFAGINKSFAKSPWGMRDITLWDSEFALYAGGLHVDAAGGLREAHPGLEPALISVGPAILNWANMSSGGRDRLRLDVFRREWRAGVPNPSPPPRRDPKYLLELYASLGFRKLKEVIADDPDDDRYRIVVTAFQRPKFPLLNLDTNFIQVDKLHNLDPTMIVVVDPSKVVRRRGDEGGTVLDLFKRTPTHGQEARLVTSRPELTPLIVNPEMNARVFADYAKATIACLLATNSDSALIRSMGIRGLTGGSRASAFRYLITFHGSEHRQALLDELRRPEQEAFRRAWAVALAANVAGSRLELDQEFGSIASNTVYSLFGIDLSFDRAMSSLSYLALAIRSATDTVTSAVTGKPPPVLPVWQPNKRRRFPHALRVEIVEYVDSLPNATARDNYLAADHLTHNMIREWRAEAAERERREPLPPRPDMPERDSNGRRTFALSDREAIVDYHDRLPETGGDRMEFLEWAEILPGTITTWRDMIPVWRSHEEAFAKLPELAHGPLRPEDVANNGTPMFSMTQKLQVIGWLDALPSQPRGLRAELLRILEIRKSDIPRWRDQLKRADMQDAAANEISESRIGTRLNTGLSDMSPGLE